MICSRLRSNFFYILGIIISPWHEFIQILKVAIVRKFVLAETPDFFLTVPRVIIMSLEQTG